MFVNFFLPFPARTAASGVPRRRPSAQNRPFLCLRRVYYSLHGEEDGLYGDEEEGLLLETRSVDSKGKLKSRNMSIKMDSYLLIIDFLFLKIQNITLFRKKLSVIYKKVYKSE